MRPVICFGEALIDLLSNTQLEVDGLALPQFTQYPGGAPANAAVAVAKLGGDSHFIGQVGDDSFGRFLIQALNRYGVKTDLLSEHPSAKTALAFISLDQTGDRSFSFYRDNSADMLLSPSQIKQQLATAALQSLLAQKPIFHFCSNTLTSDSITESTHYAVQQFIKAGATISFDVNLRHNLWPQNNVDINRVNELVVQANLLKFAKQEFEYLSQSSQQNGKQSYLKQCFAGRCELIIITDGGNTIEYFTQTGDRIVSHSIEPPVIEVVDTTAGGDGFIGGLLYGLSLSIKPISAQPLPQLIATAAQCGAIAVSRAGAFPALAVQDDVADFSQF